MARKQNKNTSIAKFNDDYDQISDNIMRVRYIRYFRGPKPPITESESAGFFVGAFLCFLCGIVVIPFLFGRDSHFDNSIASDIGSKGFIIIAFLFVIGGIVQLIRDSKKEYEPVTDYNYDSFFEYDLRGLNIKARKKVNEMSGLIKSGEDSIDDVEPVVLKGAEDYSSNTNLPLLIKAGEDGMMRASNYKFMYVYPGEKALHIYTTYLNLCDGTSKFDHVYVCNYEDLAAVRYIKRSETTADKKGRPLEIPVKSFIIASETGNTSEVFVNIKNYSHLEKTGGRIDESDAKAAYERLRPLVPENPNRKQLADAPKQIETDGTAETDGTVESTDSE